MLSDIEIAQNAEMYPIGKIAAELSISEEDIEYYGHYKAKLSEQLFQKLDSKPNGKLILVTAINPTPAGEGKTTVSVGLADALHQIGKKTVLALREPSLGPVFGIKGGAAGGGYAQVVPMEDINLHFTGDMHAITSANNLLCAMLDNHMQQGNVLRIDQRRVMLKRVLDMNDRALRNIVIGLGGKVDGIPRSDSFQITVASEVMAILCLASDLADLKERLGKILVAYDLDGNPVYAKDLGANGAMTTLLKDALKPNLVQTLEHTPALIHGGPFANIAHGCNSIRATKLALKLGDYCVTEAGFGSDLGAEKFFDIKCRYGGLKPDCVVLVATVVSISRGRDETVINKRRVDKSVVYRAMTIVAMAFLVIAITSGVIMVTTPPEVSAIDAVYEAVSAFGTVGLTTGLTPDLSIVAKILVMLTMFIGRVGPISLVLALTMKHSGGPGKILPEGKVIVG